MSHAIYQTSALILKTSNTKESDKFIYLYTEKFGLIYATMQSLRELKSKMRYHIHPYSLVEVDLVSGKHIWRVTGVHEKISAFKFIETPWYSLISIISETLVRLCAGEEQNESLWNDIDLFFNNLSLENEVHIKEYEIITMVRILYSLGYWDDIDELLKLKNPYTAETFLKVRKKNLSYIKKINQSLYDSQL
jgi:DNA repair protein RecO (recombination protein O)